MKCKFTNYLIISLFFIFLFSGVADAEEETANYTKEDALTCIDDSYAMMNELASNGFAVNRVNDSIKTLENMYADQEKIIAREQKPDYNGVMGGCVEIKSIGQEAYLARDEMFVLEGEYALFLDRVKNFNINLSDMEYSMNDLRQEMADERYERLIEKIPQVREDLVDFEASATTLNLYYSTVSKGIKEFIIDNRITIAVTIVVIIFFIIYYRVRFRRYLIRRKIRNLELEKGIVADMIQKTQRTYFEEQNMSEGEFNIKTKKFAELIRDIERQLPLLKEELAMMEKNKKFKLEDLIKEGRNRRHEKS